jgi:hypothetical protein
MSMSKKDFVALADHLKEYRDQVTPDIQLALICFCREANPNFMPDRWVNYLNGKCGKNGGKIKA